MAVNIDTVYQRVLAIANKEQRGYITPQEFNLFANQAQMDIFEEYFYSLGSAVDTPGNDTEYSDKVDILNEKISIFQHTANLEYEVAPTHHYSTFEIPEDIYQLGTVYYSPLGDQLVTDKYFTYRSGSEIISNTSLDSNITNWNKPSSITVSHPGSAGVIISNNSNANTYPALYSDYFTLVPGKTYALTYEVIAVNKGANTVTSGKQGNPKIFVKGNQGGYRPLYQTDGSWNKLLEVGKHRHFFTWDLTSHNNDPNSYYYTDNAGNTQARVHVELANANVANMSCQITDISIKEVGTDWSFQNNYLGSGWVIGSAQKSNNTKKWSRATHIPGEAHYLQQTLDLTEGSTYSITFNVQDATNGRILLANHLSETTDIDHSYDGSSDSMTIWNRYHANGRHTKYWKQGPVNTSKLSLYADKNFDGSISRIVIREISDLEDSKEVEYLQERELKETLKSKLLKPTVKNPAYIRKHDGIIIYPTVINSGIRCNYIKKPNQVNWAYTEINGVAMYNAENSVNFELHDSEEKLLVTKILGAAGIVIKDPFVSQQAQATILTDTQMKKQ